MSVSEDNERQNARYSLSTYTERFYDTFPYYLSIGMTYQQYWEDDPTLTIYYRKANELRNNYRNQELWLQGLYVYEAICDASPILNASSKKGTKPRPYPASPYSLTENERKKEAEEKERRLAEKGRKIMENIMAQNNKRFNKSKSD